MCRIRKHPVYLSLFVALLLPSVSLPATDDGLLPTINHLLRYVEDSKCVFMRNDKEYDSKEAAQHLQMKYDFLKYRLKTPEEFIEFAASRSFVSGKPYSVRCDGHSPIPTSDWLTNELSKYRKMLQPTLPAK